MVGAAEYLLMMMRRHCVEYDLHNVNHKHRSLLMCQVSSYIGKKMMRSIAGLQEQGRYLWRLSDSGTLKHLAAFFSGAWISQMAYNLYKMLHRAYIDYPRESSLCFLLKCYELVNLKKRYFAFFVRCGCNHNLSNYMKYRKKP